MIRSRNRARGFSGGGAAPPFVPTDIAGLALWLDASDTATITQAANEVSQWNDKSGNNNHATQGVGANQPLTNLNTINGKNVIYFGGLVDSMSPASVPFDPASNLYTVFCMSKGAVSNTFDNVWSFGTGLLRQEDGSATNRIYGTNTASVDGQVLGNQTPQNIVTIRSNGLNRDATYNGGNIKSGAGANTTTSANLYLGSRNGVTNLWEGDLGELLFFNRALSNSEMNLIGSYLATKWGITWTNI